MNISKNLFCLKCNQNFKKNDFVKIYYWQLIQEYELTPQAENKLQRTDLACDIKKFDKKQQQSDDKVYRNLQVPALFNLLYPKITFDEYKELCRRESFRNQSINICTNCYLQYTKLIEEKMPNSVRLNYEAQRTRSATFRNQQTPDEKQVLA